MNGEVPHPGLAWLQSSADGRAWLARLPRLVRECATRWELTLGEPFAYAMASLAMPATRADGEPVVLKIQYPDREGTEEAEALRRYDGDGAVRLLDHDPERWGLLLERCRPGAHLSSIDARGALEVLIGLVPRLWVEADEPFTRLEDEAGLTLDRRLLDETFAAIEDPVTTQPERVLLHQDLHGDNVVSARREPWLVIDPKPLVGEKAFALAPIVRSHELGHSREQVVDRLDTLSARLGVDRERARRWTIAQTVAWCDDEPHPDRRLAPGRVSGAAA